MKSKGFSSLVLIAALAFVAGCGKRQEAPRNAGGGQVSNNTTITISGTGITEAGLLYKEENPDAPEGIGNGIEPDPYWEQGDDTICDIDGITRMTLIDGVFSTPVEIETDTRVILNIVYEKDGECEYWAAVKVGGSPVITDGITVTVHPKDSSPVNLTDSFAVPNGKNGGNLSIRITGSGSVVPGGSVYTDGDGSNTVTIRYKGALSQVPSLGGLYYSEGMNWNQGYSRTMTAVTGGYEYTFKDVDFTILDANGCVDATVATAHNCLTFNAASAGFPAGGYAVNNTGIVSGTWEIEVNKVITQLTANYLSDDVVGSTHYHNLRAGITATGLAIDTKP